MMKTSTCQLSETIPFYNCILQKRFSFLIFLFVALCTPSIAQVTYTTTSNTNWSTMTWSPSGTPTSSDNVIIAHNVTANVPVEVNNLTVNASRTLQIGSNDFTVNGTSSLNGIFRVFQTGGLITFKDAITIAASGRLDNTTGITANIEIQNSLTSAGTVSLLNGSTLRFSTNNQTISGAGVFTIDNIIISGNIELANSVSTTAGLTCNVSLDGTSLNSTFINNANARLKYKGADVPMLTAGVFSVDAASNTVEYNGSVQEVKQTTYYHIRFSAAGAKNINDITVLGDFIRTNGTLNLTGVQLFSGSNDASLNTNAALTFEEINITKAGATLTLLNNNITSGKLNVAAGTFSFGNSARTVTLTDDLSGAGRILMNSASHVLNLGGAQNTIGTFESDNINARVNYNRTGDQEVFGSLNYQAFYLSGSGTKTLGGTVRIGGNLNMSSSGSYFLDLGDNTLKLASVASLTGTFSNSRYIITSGEGLLIKEGATANDFRTDMSSSGLYPIGSGDYYTPFTINSLTATVTGTGFLMIRAVPTRQPNIPYFNNALTKHWEIETSNISGINANIRFNFNNAEVIGSVALYSPRVWTGSALSTPNNPSAPGSNPFASNATTFLSGSWTAIDPTVRSALYSYQSGDWSDPNTWTTDPSGNTLVSPMIPTEGDQVVILNGRTVVNSGAATTVGSLTIQNGAVLDLANSTGHSFGPISGEGRLRLSSVNLPSGNYNNFVSAVGGTIEYYSTGSSPLELPNTQTTYNNLQISNYTSSSMQIVQNHNITLNGNLVVSKSSSGTATFTLGNSGSNRTLNINKNVTIGAGCIWNVGNFNSSHTINVYGNLVNDGIIDFTNGSNYATTSNGVANIHFQGVSTNTSITLNNSSSTTFFGFQSTKNTGYQLSVNASSGASALFVNRGNTFQANGNGILRFGANINIPVMIGGGGGNFDIGSSSSIPTLWIDGANITDGGLGGAVVPYGTLKISSGSFNCENGQKAIVIRESGALEITGGTVSIGIMRTSVTAVTHRGSFLMSGGTFNLLGNGSSEQTYYAIFSLPYPENVFKMYGGTINLTRAISAGGITPNGGFMVASTSDNYDVTGGTVNFNSTGNIHLDVTSSAPLYDVNIGRASAGTGQVRLNSIDWSYNGNVANKESVPATQLTVLNNLVINSSGAATLNAGDQDLVVTGNMTVGSSATLISGNNAIRFNSAGAQTLTVDGIASFQSGGGSNLINGPESIVNGPNYTFEKVSGTQNVEMSPIGTLTAEFIKETNNNGTHRFYTPFIPSSGPITSSIYVKPNGRTCVSLQVGSYNQRGIAWFNLTGGGSVVSTNPRILAATITSEANGWFRISATANGSSDFRVRVVLGNNSCSETYSGNNSLGIFAWGLKVENGSVANPYLNLNSTGINSLVVNKIGSSALSISGSVASLNLKGSLLVNSGVLVHGSKTLNVEGNVTNNTSISGSGSGKINLNGASPQIIYGDGDGVFRNLTLSNTGGSAGNAQVVSTAGFQITNNLDLNTDRVFDIKNSQLTIDAAATITSGSGNFGINKFIRTNGYLSDGGISKAYSPSLLTCMFPFGTDGNYTPATIAFSSAPTTIGVLNVRPVNAQQLYVTDPNAFNYYWKVRQTGFSGIAANSINLTFNYGNLTDNTSYIPGYYNFEDIAYTTINNVNAVNESTNEILFTSFNQLEGDFTAGVPAAFGTVVPYYSRSSGNWSTASTWSNTGHGGNASATIPNDHVPVFIGDGNSFNHTVTVTANNTTSGSLLIGAGSTLDVGTKTGNNFGALPYSTAGGAGSIRISSATAVAEFPAGDFGLFFQPNGGTTEYYTTSQNFTLPVETAAPTTMEISTYRKLNFAPTASYRIAFPEKDLTIYEDVTISGASSTSEVNLSNGSSQSVQVNGNLVLNGGMLRMRGAEIQTMLVDGNISVAAGARIDALNSNDAQNVISLNGNLTNNGILDFNSTSKIILNLIGNSSTLIDGSTPGASADFYLINVDKGTDESLVTELTMQGTITSPTSNWLNLVHGTFRVSRAGTLVLNNQSNLPFAIPANTKLSVNHTGATVNIAMHNSNGSDLIVGGTLELIHGTVNVGSSTNTAHNDLEYTAAGIPRIDVRNNSMLSINGQFRRSVFSLQGSVDYSQSGNSTVLVRGRNPENASSLNLDRAKFEILNENSSFEMSDNSLLIIDRSGNSSNMFGDIYLNPQSFTLTGGEVVVGTGNTPSNTVFSMYALSPFYNLRVDGTTTNKFVSVVGSGVTVLNNLFIEGNSEYRANGMDLSVGGDFSNTHTSSGLGLNSGGYKAGTTAQVTYLNGTGSSQSMNGFGSNLTNFANLVINNTNPTSEITLSANTAVRVNGTLSLISGDVNLGDNNMTVLGHITSNVNMTSDAGTLILSGSSAQTIGGDGSATVDKLKLSNSAGAELTAPLTINENLNFNQGIFYINNYLLTLGENLTVSGSPNSNMMIRLNGVVSDAGVKKNFAASDASFVFPMGTTLKYTPATYSTSGNSALGTITIKPVNVMHPATTDALDLELNYYWSVSSTGFTSGATFNHAYEYFPGDALNGNESNYVAGRFFNNVWTPAGGIPTSVNSSTDMISITSVNYLNGDYTAGETTEFGVIQTYFSRTATLGGNWNDPNSWSTDAILQHDGAPAVAAPVGKNIVIGAGHTITVSDNGKSAPTSVINGNLVLGNTFGHNLGVVNGTGLVRLTPTASNTFIFPGGDFSLFNLANGGTFEYNSSVTASLPSQAIYNNLLFTGSGLKNLPYNDLLVNGNYSIMAGSVTNIANRVISIKGNWLNQVGLGGYNPGGLGIIRLIGLNQTITGATSFGDLRIEGGGIKELSSSVNCKDLHLLSGVVKTNANELSIASNGSVFGGAQTSYVNGNLNKGIPASALQVNFEIGDDLNYVPVTLTFIGSVNTGGSITAKTEMGDYPNMYLSGLNDMKSCNRTWTLTASSLTGFTSYTAKLNFVSSDLDPAANANSLEVSRYFSGVWNLAPSVTNYPLYVEASGLTGFGTMQAAEALDGIIWTGNVNTNWNLATNWQPNVVPGSEDNIVIGLVTNQPNIYVGNNGVCKGLTMGSGSSITIPATHNLSVGGSIDANNSMILGNGLMVISGSSSIATGTISIASNFEIATGAVLSLGSSTSVEFQKNVTLSGQFNVNQQQVVFAGAQSSVLSGNPVSFESLLINKSAEDLELVLNTNINVNGTVNLLSADLNLNQMVLNLGATGVLLNESNLNRAYGAGGYITAQRTLNNFTDENVAGLGLVLSSPENLGLTTINRGHQQRVFNAGFGIDRFYDVHPTNNSDLDATMKFNYFEQELATSLGTIQESELDLWRFDGAYWNVQWASLDVSNNQLVKTNIPEFSTWTAGSRENNALPISLINFDGKCNGSMITLKWATASESNNKVFFLEESEDAIAWTTVKTIQGAGNSTTQKNYEERISSKFGGSSYFRLTQVDFNGSMQSFDPIFINCEESLSNEVSISPNPARDYTNVSISTTEDLNARLTLFSSSGQILFAKQLTLVKGVNNVRLDISDLPPGAYHMNIANDKRLEISGGRSLIKQ